MEQELVQKHTASFLLFLKNEKQVAENTCRSYASDLHGFLNFWHNYELVVFQFFKLKTFGL